MKTVCECQSGLPVYARGVCKRCYDRAYRARVKVDPSKTACECGSGKPVYGRGVCKRCYDKAHRQGEHLDMASMRVPAEPLEVRRAKASAVSIEWQKKHPEKTNKNHQDWKRRNPEKVKAMDKAWRAANKDKIQVKDHRRRALMAGAEGTFTLEEWRETLEDFAHRCAYCAASGQMTMDHVTPLVKGGRHDRDNIVPACRSCNSRKRDLEPLQFARLMAWPKAS